MNNIDLNGRTAIVTGGADGIGGSITDRFLASGASVIMWDISQDNLDDKLGASGASDRLQGVKVDVTDPGQVTASRDSALAAHDKIDILVCNAGVTGPAKKSWEYSYAEWRSVLNLDLDAVFVCCQSLLTHMIDQGYGRIVNIASIAGKEGNPNACAYSAAKAGVIGLTKSLAKETAETGVVINCVTPAAIRTAIFDQITQEHVDYMLSRIPMGRLGQTKEAAALVAWLASEDCSFSTGGVFDLSGGRATY
ncbi:MAG: SDR family NAD(P)-dependent oxidoreductase [Alphaproteobacteria bacterium]|jgi:3-oxoacyl-[acyl-carrier protein] reductase|nr:3-oxoacyl-ACP reductase [Rhodospirillaceae bacterium]MDP6022147.1 SDR family NAD(P)-dependent oxidoreductase [Alphaproteobacteria bacterium]MDP6254847.1 SDR family NAD(P)-dependent oxidoreductase [Alphaproteobacteria bacterium]MDP7053388.1 SDR family NAD(P)-dependent oxidoreductase [Alphaproteobacteria bacterium]MDP7228926.1 SDR family NAD(P)-dependent oxidoreductase [Alphaproteobacteria bacterium]|tara:strand:+ start:818 stop:1570 length:753 start_codon:yes stop_codon:yes gene_type:complete